MKTIIALCTVVSLSACGVFKDMDNISSNMTAMNKRIDSMANNINSMNGSVGGMAGSLSSTSRGMHSQSLIIAMNEMLKSENTKYITLTNANIVPMIPYAKAIAEMASADELAGIAFIWLAEINTCTVDSFAPSKEVRDSVDLGKWIKLNALQVVSAFIPVETINELVESQINNDGIYKSAVYAILTLRYNFIKDYLIDQSLNGATKFVSPIQYETALNYLESISYLNKSAFKGNLSFKLYGFYDTDSIGLNQTVSIDSNEVVDYYTLLLNKFDVELDCKYKTDVRYKNAIQSIESRIKKGMSK